MWRKKLRVTCPEIWFFFLSFFIFFGWHKLGWGERGDLVQLLAEPHIDVLLYQGTYYPVDSLGIEKRGEEKEYSPIKLGMPLEIIVKISDYELSFEDILS